MAGMRIRGNPGVLLAMFAVIGLLAYYCYRNPDCPVCQFLDAFN
jgi:hypothetical protein